MALGILIFRYLTMLFQLRVSSNEVATKKRAYFIIYAINCWVLIIVEFQGKEMLIKFLASTKIVDGDAGGFRLVYVTSG